MAKGDERTFGAFWQYLLRGRGRRAWTAVLVWPLAAGVVLLAAVRLAGLDRGALLVQLTAFAPYLIQAGLVVGLVAALARRPYAAALGALVTVAMLLTIIPRMTGEPAKQGTGVVVMSINLLFGGADPAAIVSLVRSADVDVLALQEFSPTAEQRLADAGLTAVLPFRESHPDDSASGSALYSRLPLRDGGVRYVTRPGFAQAYATITIDTPAGGRSITIESVHPTPPLDAAATPRWETALGNQIRGDAPGPPRILAGDFNATLDHWALRALLATGYRDAADEVGAGLVPTWPYAGPRSLVTPKITIDHVLVPAGLGVGDFRAVTIPDSDHRAIIATILVP